MLENLWRRRVGPPILCLILGVSTSLIAFAYVAQRETSAQGEYFALRAEQAKHELRRGVEHSILAARLLNDAIATSDNPSDAIRIYATPIQKTFPYVIGLDYHPIGRETRLATTSELLGQMPDGGLLTLGAWSGARGAQPRALGYQVTGAGSPLSRANMGSDAALFRRAVQPGGVIAGPLFPLEFKERHRWGMRLVMPRYKSVSSAGRSALAEVSGFSSITIDVGAMFASIASSLEADNDAPVNLAVYRDALANPRDLVYRSGADRALRPSTGTPCWFECAARSVAFPLEWAGQQWRVVVSDDPTAYLLAHQGAFTLLLAGLFITAVCSSYVHVQQGCTAEATSLVERRTAELRSLNTILTGDIQARKILTDELERSRGELRELAQHNARVKENERKRIAREIHDELGQSLLALRIDLALLAREQIPESVGESLRKALAKIDRMVDAMRTIINELRPAVLDLGLDAALEWEVSKFERRTGIECSLRLPASPLALSDEISTALYRVVQESMMNIMRHAQAKHVDVSLWCRNDWVFLELADDGVGMSNGCRRKAESFGLIGIAERVHALGGNFDTKSAPGQGTVLSISVPHVPILEVDVA